MSRLSLPDCRPGFLIFLGVVLTFTLALFGDIVAAGDASLPYSLSPSDEWIGYDGNWSPVTVRIGSPPQWVYLLPNTLTSETWTIGQAGCDGTLECRSQRGGTFLANESSTWSQSEGVVYEMGYTVQLGDGNSSYYGFDNIALDEETIVHNQVLGIYNNTNWWIGSLGLGVEDANFNPTLPGKLSFLNSLDNASYIPSRSYGYTAGAYHRLTHVPISLTLGGFDRRRFIPNDVSFNLAPNHLPVVAIQSVEMSMGIISTPVLEGDDSGLVSLTNNYLFKVDSSTPFFWFPEKICDAFANALKLTYNETQNIYTYGTNETSRYDYLVDKNLKFTFTLSNYPGANKSVEIELPVSALGHRLTFPFPRGPGPNDEGIRYFPMRKANNPRQYTIGRAFLQEAYLIVDYERDNFSISQANFESDAMSNMDIVAILSPSKNTSSLPDENSSLSTGAKAGLGVGASIAVFVIGFSIFFCVRRRKRGGVDGNDTNTENQAAEGCSSPIHSELVADKRFPTEAPAGTSATRIELPEAPPSELPGSEPDESYSASKLNDADHPPSYTGTLQHPTLEPITENSKASPSGHTTLPSYSLHHTRPVDTSLSEPVSAITTSLAWTNDGLDSAGSPSPMTALGERSASGSIVAGSQSSTSQLIVENTVVRSASRFSEQLEDNEQSAAQSQQTTSRRPFSFEGSTSRYDF